MVEINRSKSRQSNWPKKLESFIPFELNKNWSVAVFVCKSINSQVLRLNKEKYLSMLGGQTQVYCKEHEYPLVMTIQNSKSNKRCVCAIGCIKRRVNLNECPQDNHDVHCSHKACYECPVQNCKCYICKQHHSQVKNSEFIKLMLGKRSELSDYQCFLVEEEENSMIEESNDMIDNGSIGSNSSNDDKENEEFMISEDELYNIITMLWK